MSGRVGEFSVNFVHDGGDAEGREAVLTCLTVCGSSSRC